MPDMQCKVGKFYTLSSNTFTKYYTVAYDMQGGAAGKAADVAYATFLGWYDTNGTFVGHAGDLYTPSKDTTLVAHWLIKIVIHYDGNGATSGSMEDDQKTRGISYLFKNSTFTKDANEFVGWSTTPNATEKDATYDPGNSYNTEQSLNLFAIWKPKFDIAYIGVNQTQGKDSFDNNGQVDYSQLDGNVLLKGSDMYINTTKSYTSKEDESTVTENITATGVGWAFHSGVAAKDTKSYLKDNTTLKTSDFYEQAANANAVTVGSTVPEYKGEAYTLNSGNMAVANLFRVWDYGPMIEAYDLYYSLADAQAGNITEKVLLDQAMAIDDEDGIILSGVHEKNSFIIMDYATVDFTQCNGSGSVTETYQATDSVGNSTKLKITVHITDTTATVVKKGTTRFIDEKYYNCPYDQGGIEDTSIWKNDPIYSTLLENIFVNIKNNTPMQSYELSPEIIQKMKAYMKEQGAYDVRKQGALKGFYEKFLEPNQTK